VTSSIFFSVYGVLDLKNKPMKLCVTYKIKLYKIVVDDIKMITFMRKQPCVTKDF